MTGALLGGCGTRSSAPDLVNGKALFIGDGRCGSCHTLARAGTQGRQGPNLDEAFGPARRDGLGNGTIEGVTYGQIGNVRANSTMPEDLVTGEDRRDVAAYVAAVAGLSGEDTGALAQAGVAGATDGRQIFTAAGCGSCHVLAAAGTSGNIGPGLDDLAGAAAERQSGVSAEEYVTQAIVEPDTFVVDGFQAGVMPGNYGDQLEDEQVQALTEYLLNPR